MLPLPRQIGKALGRRAGAAIPAREATFWAWNCCRVGDTSLARVVSNSDLVPQEANGARHRSNERLFITHRASRTMRRMAIGRQPSVVGRLPRRGRAPGAYAVDV